jgi:Photosynthetic reaction centre cytochrome C subunit
MRLSQGMFLLTLVACGAGAYQQRPTPASQQPSTASRQPGTATSTQANPNQDINNRYVQQFSEKIAGREKEPAEKVFKNIQIEWFKSVPSGVLLRIMNGGYSRALGVSCTHCHVEQDFASDDKRPKRAAREMAAMHRMINEQLEKMQNLETKPQERAINCSTCHRGAIDPMAAER